MRVGPKRSVRWGGWAAGVVLVAVVGISLFKTGSPTIGQTYLAALDASQPAVRAAAMVIDYAPDEVEVAKAKAEIVERGEGAPGDGAVGAMPEADRRWIRAADAMFTWRKTSGEQALRDALRAAGPVLGVAVARGPLDDAGEVAAEKAALAALEQLTDEQLLLAWLNADRGMLAAGTDRAAAVRQAVLLLVPGGGGAVLTFRTGEWQVYLLAEEPTNDAQWCKMECFDKTGRQVWAGRLRVKKDASTERVRTLAAMFAREAR